MAKKIMLTVSDALYASILLATKKGNKVQDTIRNILSEEINDVIKRC